jgi:hypothetical protein
MQELRYKNKKYQIQSTNPALSVFSIKSQYKKYIVCCTTCRILYSERAGQTNSNVQMFKIVNKCKGSKSKN